MQNIFEFIQKSKSKNVQKQGDTINHYVISNDEGNLIFILFTVDDFKRIFFNSTYSKCAKDYMARFENKTHRDYILAAPSIPKHTYMHFQPCNIVNIDTVKNELTFETDRYNGNKKRTWKILGEIKDIEKNMDNFTYLHY